jgi:hypothetical protein
MIMRRFEMSNLKRLGNQMSVSLKADGDGYLGRECPVESCQGYFKIAPGTGVAGAIPCHCPYCGHSGENQDFTTKEQLEYAKSMVFRRVTDAVHQDLKSMEFNYQPLRGGFGIGVSLKVTQGPSHPIQHYREKQLETEIICDACTLRYAIYGVFGWCPDCGVHNSLQILTKNLELAGKELALAASVDRELADHLIGDALENVVSAFDGFGREICERAGTEIRFQNLPGARKNVQSAFGFDFADTLEVGQWEIACQVFQKRHLIAHRMGVVDEDYVQKTNDASAIPGRKVRISHDEVESATAITNALGHRLFDGIMSVASSR